MAGVRDPGPVTRGKVAESHGLPTGTARSAGWVLLLCYGWVGAVSGVDSEWTDQRYVQTHNPTTSQMAKSMVMRERTTARLGMTHYRNNERDQG